MTISLQPTDHWTDASRLIIESLRPIAQNMIKSLDRRMEVAQDKSFYLEQIKKVITYEQNRVVNRKRGDYNDYKDQVD